MKKSKKTATKEVQAVVESAPKMRRFMFPSRNGKKSVVVEAETLKEAQEKYQTL